MSNSGGLLVPTHTQGGAVSSGGVVGTTEVALFDSSTDQVWQNGRQAADADNGQKNGAVAIQLFNGATWERQRTPKVFKVVSALSVATEATIWTPTSGKKFRLMGIVFDGSVAGDYVLKDNTAGTTIFIFTSGATTNSVHASLGNGILSAAANNVLTCTGPALSTLSGTVFGTEE